ncbi:hypothetical protein [Streptomyces sp. NPDC003832]
MTEPRVMNQTIGLGDNPDAIKLVEHNGVQMIEIGSTTLTLGMSDQATLDKLAVVAANAAADKRASTLWAVS